MKYIQHLCGYVHLKSDHPCYGIEYDDLDFDVHGGITFAKKIGDDWVIGFDCGHSFDIVPERSETHSLFNKLFDVKKPDGLPVAYRNIEYVKSEIEKLVKQLKDKTDDR